MSITYIFALICAGCETLGNDEFHYKLQDDYRLVKIEQK